jgi:hypothetical protein
MSERTRYDVFLSYNRANQSAVEALARRLREEHGLNPFLDEWHLVPGEPWQEALEEALDSSQSCAVFLGPAGLGTWENEEMRAALDLLAGGVAAGQVVQLLDDEASGAGICQALADLAGRVGPDDTAVVFFSGHGAHTRAGGGTQYLLPYDCDLADLPGTALSGEKVTSLLQEIQAGRLLVLFDSCHSGGAGEPKGVEEIRAGLEEDYYQALAQGKGRVVMASSRPDEVSWALAGMKNSLFTHYLLEALRGSCRTLGDGYVRVFDLFRHVAEYVPTQATQHPIFKAAAMEEDFPVALAPNHPSQASP